MAQKETAPLAPTGDPISAREAAMRDVLETISRNRDNDTPVFDTILERACALCDAPLAGLILGTPDDATQTLAAHIGMFDDAVELFETGQMKMDGSLSYAARSIIEGRLIAFADMGESDLYAAGSPVVRSMVDTSNIRSVLFVPLLKDGRAIGNLTLFRRELRAFDPSEIALVETFAAQAVIAVENVRQFYELQSRLEREAASREILQVISASRTDLAPVFDMILKNAARLSGAPLANLCLVNDARSHWDLVAHYGDGLRHLAVGKTSTPIDSELTPAVAIRTAQVVQIEDLRDTELYRQRDPGRVTMVDVEGMRTILCVPLLRGNRAIGSITLFRREVKGFSSDEIALVESFAAQAVIAIENVRQFLEVQRRLEREAATKQVLHVISQSRDDEMPVFRMILKQAERLCNAQASGLQLVTDDRKHLRMAVGSGQDRGSFQPGYLFDLSEPLSLSIAVRERRVVHKEDLKNDDLYRQGHPGRRKLVDEEGVLTQLAVPLIQADTVIGTMTLSRLEQKPFSSDEIALVETFAAQAVIAIENVRQFKALETLNAELGDRVEAQVGELERMGKLKRFLPEQVADAVVSSGDDSLLSSHRALISALFCDIRGFTAFCETAEPEETIEVLQAYHEEMGKLIAAHSAGVDHRAGDGIMVLFNDPLPCDDPAGNAVRLAFAMRETMHGLCKNWRKMGHRLGFGVGISLGYATVGMVGSEGRYHYTASGTAVNLAARLCDLAADGEILLSPRAHIAVEEEIDSELMGEVEIKGISAPVEVYRAVAAKG